MENKNNARLGKGLSSIFGQDVSKVLDDIQNGDMEVESQEQSKIPVDEILDLVGNVADQLNLEQQIREYLARMSQELSNETAKSIPVSKMLDHLRAKAKEKQEQGESFFAYSAIKAADIPIRSISYPFQNGRSEKLFLPTRQQLFCAEGYEDRIKAKDFHKIYRLVKSSYQKQKIPVVRNIK